MAVHRCLPSSLMQFERIILEEWDKLLKSRCAKLVEIYPSRHKTVTAAKTASTSTETCNFVILWINYCTCFRHKLQFYPLSA